MTSSLNKVSTLVQYQLPQFIRDDHPVFVEFLTKYYEYLEQPGNPVYELKKFEDNYDVDTTRESMLQYFKSKILPSFPESTELSTERILKSARDFYTKKGTPDSFKFLFRVLYNTELEVYFPKLQIFKASDGKWVQPQAFRLTLSAANQNLDINLLEKHKGYGSLSRASCIIEAANRTIDKSTNREIIEIYISNLNRFYQNGEYLEISYVDANGATQLFSEKIIGAISNIKINPNRRGTKYVTGDPVVINGGLDAGSQTKTKAVAFVGNVTTGSIDSVSLLKRGYGFRALPNSLVDIITANGIGANVIVSGVDSVNAISIDYATDSILYKANSLLNVSDYDFDNAIQTYANLTIGAGNTTSAVNLKTATFTPSSVTDYYKSQVLTIVSGTGSGGTPNTATITAYNGTTKIATLSNALGIAPGATSNISLTSNANTTLARAFSFESLSLAPLVTMTVVNGGSFFDGEPDLNVISLYESDYSKQEGLLTVSPGLFNSYNNTAASIVFAGVWASSADDWYTGWRILVEKQYRTITSYNGTTKTAYLDRKFENNINQTNILTKNLYLDSRPKIIDSGKIAAIEILNGGTGYAATNVVNFIGTGYGATASLTVGGAGDITAITITDRGEGYPVAPTVNVVSTTGTGAVLTAYLFSDGEEFDVGTSKIGSIKDFTITNRGSDYVSTPNVSLKIYDINVASILESESILENDIVYQGANSNSTSFRATVDAYYPANNVLRVFNFSGTPNVGQNLIVVKTVTANVNALVQYANVEGKVYPYKYGDGKAKANAEFLNGLIKYNGFYLNTDGHVSSDKKLQDSDRYHNFSYSMVSEIGVSEYGKTLFDIGHPVGMKMLSEHVFKDYIVVDSNVSSNISSANTSGIAGTNVTAYSFYTTNKATINGSTAANVAAGDIIKISSLQNKVVLSVSNTTVYPTLTFDFINDSYEVLANNSTVVTLESNTAFIGDGRITTVLNSNTLTVSGNTGLVSNTVRVGDFVRLNLSSNVYTTNVISVTANTFQVDAVQTIFSNANNIVYQMFPTFTETSYQIIKSIS